MLYNIKNKKINLIVKSEKKLPKELKEKIDENFAKIVKSGRKVWNGDVLCASNINIDDNNVDIICLKSNYAHYLYEENVGCPDGFRCRNISAGCWLETIDGYFILGELDSSTSFPTVLQTTGGGIDKLDIVNGKIDVEKTIKREAKEELNIDLDDENIIDYKGLNYLYVSEKKDQPGIMFFAKAIIKMKKIEFEKYFEEYYKYLKENNLELEFEKLHFLKKEIALDEINKLPNPKRVYIISMIEANCQK